MRCGDCVVTGVVSPVKPDIVMTAVSDPPDPTQCCSSSASVQVPPPPPPAFLKYQFILVLSSSFSDGRLTKLNESSSDKEVEHIELIRPSKDLSIWLDEDEVCSSS